MSATFIGRLRAAAVALGLVFITAAASAQSNAPPPVEAFFQNPTFTSATISPTGRHVAVVVTPKGGRAQLVVVDTTTLAPKVVASFDDVDVATVTWISSKRLVFTIGDSEGSLLGFRLHAPGLMAVDLDGKEMRPLVRSNWGQDTTWRNAMPPTTHFHSAMRSRDSDHIWVEQGVPGRLNELDAFNLLKLDTRTGTAEQVASRPPRAMDWVTDAADAPRMVLASDKFVSTLWYQDPASGKWEGLSSHDDSKSERAIEPLGFAPDGTAFVTVRQPTGARTMAVHRYDLARRAPDPEPLIAADGFDVHAELIVSAGRLLGMRYTTDAEGTAWFDPEHKQLQAKIDQLFPGTINRIDVPWRPEVPLVLVTSFSDREPGTYSIYDKSTGKVTTVGRELPDIDPGQMGQRDFLRYKARDGLEVPAWLTLPKDGKGKKLPLVVVVHGGPWIRGGKWEWNADAQFLASRGYAVLEPEFRGSRGYGWRHYNAGWKQWGLAMQDDIADAARWAIDKGIADPARICIAGASYGGYSTLMGLVRNPELFRCGINWVGVTDIDLIYSVSWSDTSSSFLGYGMPVLVGDRDRDAAQLKATSPLEHAGKIRQPLLLAYGGSDRRVPIVHGTRFRDAVMKSNNDVEWVEYPKEGHGWYLPVNRFDFWTRVEKFLGRHLGR